MKKLLTLALLSGSIAYVQAQGSIQVYSVSPTYSILTNSVLSSYDGGTGVGGTAGKAALGLGNGAPGYDYALLAGTYNASLNGATPTISQLAGLSLALTGITNYGVAGGIAGAGHNAGGPTLLTSSWTAPQAAFSDGTGTEDSYVLVGWSGNEGSSWSQVLAELQSGNWLATGSFGASVFGAGYTGGGPNSIPAPSIFGVSSGEPNGLPASPLTLDGVVPTPEPTSIALAGLGGLAMLAFRRKKA